MKTWISNNQVLATIIGLVIIAGLIYLAYWIYNKYANSNARRIERDIIEEDTIAPSNQIPTVGVFSMSPNMGNSMGSGNTSRGPSSGAGARVSSGGGRGGVH